MRPPGSAILAQQRGLGNRATDMIKNQSPTTDVEPLFGRELRSQQWPVCSRSWRSSFRQQPRAAVLNQSSCCPFGLFCLFLYLNQTFLDLTHLIGPQAFF